MFDEAMEYGVLGYILKDSAVLDIVRAIKAVAKGKYYISPTLSGRNNNAQVLTSIGY